MKLGGLEAGGTKMVCAIGDENGTIIKRVSMPTKTPAETMPEIIKFFKEEQVEAVGIGCFGPVDLNKKSPTYGYITTTPKLAWQNYDICGVMAKELGVPIGFDTDVNAACLGEIMYGAAKGCDSAVYITIGTGVGMGIYADGRLLHGMMHPEAGHVLLQRADGDTFEGICPFHKGCMEGLCSGEAVGARYGVKAVTIAPEDIAWEYEAFYIAQACMSLVLTVSPEKIILGGGVMKQEHLYPMIREQFVKLLNGYVKTAELQDVSKYLVAPGGNDNQGVLGAFALAYEAKMEA